MEKEGKENTACFVCFVDSFIYIYIYSFLFDVNTLAAYLIDIRRPGSSADRSTWLFAGCVTKRQSLAA